MKKILEHNAQDLFSLAHLLPLLMEEEICREMGADGP
jgi:uncharacterized protein YprB with RNaseH-like and TPR domain